MRTLNEVETCLSPWYLYWIANSNKHFFFFLQLNKYPYCSFYTGFNCCSRSISLITVFTVFFIYQFKHLGANRTIRKEQTRKYHGHLKARGLTFGSPYNLLQKGNRTEAQRKTRVIRNTEQLPWENQTNGTDGISFLCSDKIQSFLIHAIDFLLQDFIIQLGNRKEIDCCRHQGFRVRSSRSYQKSDTDVRHTREILELQKARK